MTTSDNGTGWNEHKLINTGTGPLPKARTAPHISEVRSILNHCRVNYGSNGISDEYEEEVASRVKALLDHHTQVVLDGLMCEHCCGTEFVSREAIKAVRDGN